MADRPYHPDVAWGADDLENKALACKPFNFFKRDAMPPQLATERVSRVELIASFKPLINRRREHKRRELERVRSAVAALIDTPEAPRE